MSESIRKIFLSLLLISLAAGIGIYFRLYPLIYHTSSSETSERATLLVISKLKASIASEVIQSHPSLSPIERNRLIKEQFDEYLHTHGSKVRYTIEKLSLEISKSHPQRQEKFYLLESDPFLYYSLTENILKTGRMSDTIQGSKYFNPLMLAPLGHWEPLNLHPFVGYFIYRFLHIFNPSISLMYAVSFTPLIVSAFSAVAFFLVCGRLGCGMGTRFIGAVYFLLAPIFIKRSSFGWYDNDPYNTLFPLLILTVLFYGLAPHTSFRQKIYSAIVCFFLISLYALFWQGWMFLLSVITIAGILLIFLHHFILKDKTFSSQLLKFFGIIFIGTFAGIGVVFGPQQFFVLFQEGWTALNNFMTPQLSLWPDLYISVGELKKSSLGFIVELTGGWLFFILAGFGLGSSLKNALKKHPFQNLSVIVVTVTFLLSSVVITLGAQRFVLLSLIPLSLFFTLGLQNAYSLFIIKASSQFLHWGKQRFFRNFVLVIITMGLIFIPIRTSAKTTRSLLSQIFNETWEKTLVKIKEETPPDSVIISWWPPGHFIKAIAKRRVIFDGATINQPQAYWLANVFLSSDKRKALGILRMLNNSANQAAEYLQSTGMSVSTAIELLKEITPLNAKEAAQFLENKLSSPQITHLLKLTHRRPPPAYLLIYQELVENNIEFKFVGDWNFKEIEKINRNPELLKSVPPRNSKEFIKFLWDVAGGPLKYNPPFVQLSQQNDVITFEQNIVIDLKTMHCQISSHKFGRGSPKSIFYLEGDQVVEKKLLDSNLPYSVLLYKERELYNCVLLDERLAKSLLMQLYFFEGKGLKYFQPFVKEADLTKRTQIFVYRIDWNSFESDLNSGE